MASIEDLAAYTLPRDQTESGRLNRQHEVYKQQLGYLLHPTIAASLPPTAHIADVATGTGIWLLDLVSTLPPTHTFTGLDLSPAQFPATPPPNFTFRTMNVLEPPPPELQGQFDLVNLRLLICGLTQPDWRTAARHVRLLLRPGGALQWTEGDFAHMDILQSAPGTSIAASRSVFDFVIASHQRKGKMVSDDVRRLRGVVEAEGFVECREDVVSSDRVAEGRMEGSVIGVGAINSLARNMAREGGGGEGIEESCEAAVLEIGDGVYWRWNIHTIVARKPL
ncbi:methyltransferase [Teratosphaeria destructans]|uniref:Methyltransferase n=1 Tax=Teratosphaeria destructans TaxID=418781 RepID=A0A9W7VZJ1_9PEZI|nr:methyltransferase [Teratosphaeria destructans]